MTLNRLPNESLSDYKFRLLLDKAKGNISESWKEVAEAVDPNLSESAIRIGTKFLPEYEAYIKSKLDGQEDSKVLDVKYKETVETLNDGSIRSDKLIQLSKEDMLKPERIMELHGYDPKLFELTNSKHSMWNVGRDGDTLYSSKVTVKPIKSGIDFDKIIEKLKVEPKYIQQPTKTTDRLLVVPYVDLHIGLNSLEDYQEKLDETLEIIQSKKWDSIYIPIGNDGLNCNNHNNTTVSGTLLEPIDLDKAADDFYDFYTILFDASLKQSKNVTVDYIQGNHDADMTWMLVKIMSKKYPQIKWDTSMEIKKFFKWKNVLLVNLHGDKSLQRVSKVLLTEYRDLMVNAKCVEIHSGHFHREKVLDEYGIVNRTLPSVAKTDKWHRGMAFEGARKTSQIFEYAPDKLKTIYHV